MKMVRSAVDSNQFPALTSKDAAQIGVKIVPPFLTHQRETILRGEDDMKSKVKKGVGHAILLEKDGGRFNRFLAVVSGGITLYIHFAIDVPSVARPGGLLTFYVCGYGG